MNFLLTTFGNGNFEILRERLSLVIALILYPMYLVTLHFAEPKFEIPFVFMFVTSSVALLYLLASVKKWDIEKQIPLVIGLEGMAGQAIVWYYGFKLNFPIVFLAATLLGSVGWTALQSSLKWTVVNMLLGLILSVVASISNPHLPGLFFVFCFMASSMTVGLVAFMRFRLLNHTNEMYSAMTKIIKQNEVTRQQLSSASSTISTSIGEQASVSERTAQSLELVASDFVTTTAHLKESSQQGEHGRNSMDKILQALAGIQEAMLAIKESFKDVESLGEYLKTELGGVMRDFSQIRSATSSINDIVFQTKLLSFNASVEAARAADAGKGFAVVAEEVNVLAQQSSKFAAEISQSMDQESVKIKTVMETITSRVEGLIEAAGTRITKSSEALSCVGRSSEDAAEKIAAIAVRIVEISQVAENQSAAITKAVGDVANISRAVMSTESESQLLVGLADQINNQSQQLEDVIYKSTVFLNV